MNNITILDLFLMLTRSKGDHQVNIDILKSIYEQTRGYYIAIFTAVLVLVGGILGSFITSLTQEQNTNNYITWIALVAAVILVISLVLLINRMNRLQRNYLDILQVYHLLARLF